MRAVSFAWTSPALVLGLKTETRRDWTKAWLKPGEQFVATNKQRWFKGSVELAICTCEAIWQEDSRAFDDNAYEAEGFPFLQAIGAKFSKGVSADAVADFWKRPMFYGHEPFNHWVLRFRVEELLPAGEVLRDQWLTHDAFAPVQERQ